MKKNSLTIKTLLYLVLFSIVILLLLWVIQIQMLELSYERYQINNIKEVAKKINSNKDNIDDLLEDYAYSNDICIEYYGLQEFVGYNLKKVGCLLGNKDSNIKKYKTELITSNKSYIKLYAPITGTKSIIYSIKTSSGYIFLNTNLEDINTTTKILKKQLVYIILFLIVLSLIMSLFISKLLNKPILKLTKKARELGKGNYNIKFEKTNVREIDELADVLTLAASEMNQTDKLRRDLVANVSHDIKTPLTMIKAYAEKVKDISYKNDEQREKDLNVIIEETDRLNVLVNDLLDLSKIEAGVNKLNIEEYDLTGEIESILRRYDILKEKEGYTFITSMPKKVMIKADKSKLNQVIYNLINNAIEHAGEDLTVKITVKKIDSRYKVSITNSGEGISEEDKKLVWNKYYKKDKNHKRNVVGSGIGLSIVKGVLESHNFEYGIDSKINEYTTFYFYINIS